MLLTLRIIATQVPDRHPVKWYCNTVAGRSSKDVSPVSMDVATTEQGPRNFETLQVLKTSLRMLGRTLHICLGLILCLGLAVAVIIGAPLWLLSLLFPAILANDATAVLAPLIWIALCSSLLQGAFVRIYSEHLDGREAAFTDCLSDALAAVWPGLIVAIIFLLVTLTGLVLLVVPGIILYCMLFVALPAQAGERAGVIASLRRSIALTRNCRMEIFGLSLTLQFLIAITGPFALFLSLLALLTLWPMIHAVAYLELRLLKEGAARSLRAPSPSGGSTPGGPG